jgi:hypothetical protein
MLTIAPFTSTVSARPSDQLTDISHFDGEGLVEGFRLELEDIWKGL